MDIIKAIERLVDARIVLKETEASVVRPPREVIAAKEEANQAASDLAQALREFKEKDSK